MRKILRSYKRRPCFLCILEEEETATSVRRSASPHHRIIDEIDNLTTMQPTAMHSGRLLYLIDPSPLFSIAISSNQRDWINGTTGLAR